MDANTITTLISAVGFPIVMCMALCYVIYTMWQKQKDEVTTITNAHKEEIKELTAAINETNKSVVKLVSKIDMLIGGAK